MSRDPYYVLQDVVNCAKLFSRSEYILFEPVPGHGPYPYIAPLHEIEKDLASYAFGFMQFHSEYKLYFGKLKPHLNSVRLRRAIDALPEKIETRLQRWGWDFVLADDGMKRVIERLKAHEETKWRAFLDAALSWRVGRSVEPHSGADDWADEAERLGITPTMTPEEGERVIWDRHREWYATPVLAETEPNVSNEEHGELAAAVDKLVRLFDRLDSPEKLR
jgi:hypothetical protein